MMKQHLTREMIISILYDDHLSDDVKASKILALANQDQLELLNQASDAVSELLDDIRNGLNQSFIREEMTHLICEGVTRQ